MAVYFISDLHLGARYTDDYFDEQRKATMCLDEIAKDATHIYLLGDVLDYWYEYRHVVPRGHTRFFGKLAELADRGIKITWLTGNHDIWIFDYLPRELGIRIVDGTLTEKIEGLNVFMAHGDRQGCNAISFRIIQKLFRSRICQKLFSGIHPRWTIPLALKWSGASRKAGSKIKYKENLLSAVENLEQFSRRYLKGHPTVNLFIYGHLHIKIERNLTPECKMIVLPDWMSTHGYLRLDSGIITFS